MAGRRVRAGRGRVAHLFVEDPDDDDSQWQRCARCHLPAHNAIHQGLDVPGQSARVEEHRRVEARRLGEKWPV
jgi:hypothetical protein